jgi:hypothetical protein
MTRTLTGLYDSYDDAESVVRDLEAAAIPHDHISLVANNEGDRYTNRRKEGNEAGPGAGIGAAGGAVLGGGAGLLAGLGMLAIPGVGPVVAAGWLLATAAGAVAGGAVGGAGGGLIGAMVGNGVPEQDANVYAEGVRRGGSLVTVRVEDDQVAHVEAILTQYRRVDPAVRGQAYREEGWSKFDDTAPPYSTEVNGDRKIHTNDPAV